MAGHFATSGVTLLRNVPPFLSEGRAAGANLLVLDSFCLIIQYHKGCLWEIRKICCQAGSRAAALSLSVRLISPCDVTTSHRRDDGAVTEGLSTRDTDNLVSNAWAFLQSLSQANGQCAQREVETNFGLEQTPFQQLVSVCSCVTRVSYYLLKVSHTIRMIQKHVWFAKNMHFSPLSFPWGSGSCTAARRAGGSCYHYRRVGLVWIRAAPSAGSGPCALLPAGRGGRRLA